MTTFRGRAAAKSPKSSCQISDVFQRPLRRRCNVQTHRVACDERLSLLARHDASAAAFNVGAS
jgi:hypothetical protein